MNLYKVVGGRIYSFTLVRQTLGSQSEGRHNNVKLGALFPRKYPTDRQPFYVNEKTENDAAAHQSLLPSPLIIPTFSLL